MTRVTRVTRVTSMAGGVFAGQFVSAIVQAVSLIMLARFTDPQVFGRASAVIAAVTVLTAISDVGLGTLAVKSAARNPRDPQIALILRLTLVSSVLLSILVLSVILALGRSDSVYYEFAPLAVWMVAEKRLALRSAIAVASGMVVASTRSIVIARALSLMSFWLILKAELPPTLSYTLGYTLGASVGLALMRRAMIDYGALARHVPIRSIPALVGPMVNRGAPFSIATLSYQVRTLDVTIVSLVAGPAVAGIYAVPARLSAPLRLFPTALNTVTMPIVAAENPDMMKQWTRLTRLSWIILVTVLGSVALFAEPTIVSVLGEGYRSATRPLWILCPGIALNIVGASRSSLLQASGDEVFIARMGVMLGAVSIGGVAVGAYFGGASGAALAMTLTYVLQFGIVHSRRLSRVGASV